jgi:hypothetical protein
VNQAKVRSTAHRLGITANPVWPWGLRTISIVVFNKARAQSTKHALRA